MTATNEIEVTLTIPPEIAKIIDALKQASDLYRKLPDQKLTDDAVWADSISTLVGLLMIHIVMEV